MANDLVDPADLSSFPGAPFDADLVDVTVADLRGEAGWHIAPVRTETVEVFSFGGWELPLPSLRILDVTEVRFGATIYTSGWTIYRSSLVRRAGWPVGLLEVDLTHGYESTPMELLSLIASRIGSGVTVDPSVQSVSVSLDDYSESTTYRSVSSSSGVGVVQNPTLARYSLLDGVA